MFIAKFSCCWLDQTGQNLIAISKRLHLVAGFAVMSHHCKLYVQTHMRCWFCFVPLRKAESVMIWSTPGSVVSCITASGPDTTPVSHFNLTKGSVKTFANLLALIFNNQLVIMGCWSQIHYANYALGEPGHLVAKTTCLPCISQQIYSVRSDHHDVW